MGRKPRVYIAGRMTGLPNYNFDAFELAAEAWAFAGWDVYNPAEAFGGDQKLPYRQYVDHDIDMLHVVDAVALLPGWDDDGARGSVWEEAIARKMRGIPCFDASEPRDPVAFMAERAPETILQEAQRLVHGNRGADYGHPIDDYTRTGRMWGAILGIPDIDPRTACLMMAVMKVSREVNKHKRDNLTDLAGYAECASMVAERQGLR